MHREALNPYQAATRVAAWILGGLGIAGWIAVGFLWPSPLRALEPTPPDSACRICHADTSESYVLPSGESFPVQVDMAELQASAHGMQAGSPVYCSSCHTAEERYRYPHAPNPAQSHAEFRAEVTSSCQDCHYPHLPFHDEEQMEAPPPTCVACHGSHDVARVEAMGTAMPARCLACHTEQTPEWAAEFVTPRPGLGEGAPGYAGSTRCNGCHDDLYFTWHNTLHAKMVRDPALDPDAVVGDFNHLDPDRTFERDDVVYTIGSRWRQVYVAHSGVAPQTRDLSATAGLTATGALTATTPLTAANPLTAAATGDPARLAEAGADLVLLPAQWTVAANAWEPLQGDGVAGEAWLPACGSCHVTGLNTETWGFTEIGIGCESCHGPAADHAADPQNVKPFAQVDDQVCGACHSRGTSPDGHPFPASYRPGDDLSAHFSFTDDTSALWPDGSARRNHQQYMDWNLGNSMADELTCTSCHRVHDTSVEPGQLQEPLNDLCLECHDEQRALVRHAPFHEEAMRRRTFLCSDCHMPTFADDAAALYVHSHSFLQPNPQGSINHGGLAAMPNACNECHVAPAEDAAWAVQIVSFALAQATPSSSSFFGPGPTPTSPPPPTPVSSVGQPAEVDLTEPGLGLRWALLGALGLVVVVVGYLLYLVLRPRRHSNA